MRGIGVPGWKSTCPSGDYVFLSLTSTADLDWTRVATMKNEYVTHDNPGYPAYENTSTELSLSIPYSQLDKFNKHNVKCLNQRRHRYYFSNKFDRFFHLIWVQKAAMWTQEQFYCLISTLLSVREALLMKMSYTQWNSTCRY